MLVLMTVLMTDIIVDRYSGAALPIWKTFFNIRIRINYLGGDFGNIHKSRNFVHADLISRGDLPMLISDVGVTLGAEIISAPSQ